MSIMSKSTRKNGKPATLAVDYTPAAAAALKAVTAAATAYKSYDKRGVEVILPRCVEATQEAMHAGILASPGESAGDEKPAWREAKARYGKRFGLSSGSEVTFWCRLALYLDAGGSVGDDLWLRLATAQGAGTKRYLAKSSAVGKVIDDGGSLDDIGKACDKVERAAKTRKAQPKTGKGKATAGTVPTTDDPVADALTALLAAKSACIRAHESGDTDADSWKRIRAALVETGRAVPTVAAIKARAAAERKELRPTG